MGKNDAKLLSNGESYGDRGYRLYNIRVGADENSYALVGDVCALE